LTLAFLIKQNLNVFIIDLDRIRVQIETVQCDVLKCALEYFGQCGRFLHTHTTHVQKQRNVLEFDRIFEFNVDIGLKCATVYLEQFEQFDYFHGLIHLEKCLFDNLLNLVCHSHFMLQLVSLCFEWNDHFQLVRTLLGITLGNHVLCVFQITIVLLCIFNKEKGHYAANTNGSEDGQRYDQRFELAGSSATNFYFINRVLGQFQISVVDQIRSGYAGATCAVIASSNSRFSGDRIRRIIAFAKSEPVALIYIRFEFFARRCRFDFIDAVLLHHG